MAALGREELLLCSGKNSLAALHVGTFELLKGKTCTALKWRHLLDVCDNVLLLRRRRADRYSSVSPFQSAMVLPFNVVDCSVPSVL